MINPRSIGLFLVLGVTACSGCKSPDGDKAEVAPPAAPPPVAAPPPAPAAAPVPPAPAAAASGAPVMSFKAVIAPYFESRCASDKGCHGARPAWLVDLDLRKGAAYSQLVNVGAEERSGAKRIAPGDPAGSFVLDKMLGKLHHREGKAMPVDPQTSAPVRPIPSDPDFIDNALIPWIRAGAPNN